MQQVENESLKTELAVYKSDADMVKSLNDLDSDVKEKQMKVLQETIRNLQTQLLENKSKEKENLTRITDLEGRLKQANVKELLLKTKIVEACKHTAAVAAIAQTSPTNKISESEDADFVIDLVEHQAHRNAAVVEVPSVVQTPTGQTIKTEIVDRDEARIIGLVSTFLVVHPFGASLDYVYSYVQRSAPHLRPKELEEILCRYRSIFSEEVTGIGAKIERKWKFCGFEDPVVSTQTTATS